MSDPRTTFARTAALLVEEDLSVALVYAEISGQFFREVEQRHPDRVINVGIREQLLVSVGAGLALTGMWPIVHTFGSFLVERAWEQVKLGFNHQDVGGVLVGAAGSFDVSSGGRTHQSPGDVALLDTLRDWTIYVPGHADEVADSLRVAVGGSGRDYLRVVGQQNGQPRPLGTGLVKDGSLATVVAVGPMLDPVLAAVADLDVAVVYSNRIRPFDAGPLRASAGRDRVVLVEPYLAGTSAYAVSVALSDVPHRLLSLGVQHPELRRYGTPAQHLAAHGLDERGLRASIGAFLEQGAVASALVA